VITNIISAGVVPGASSPSFSYVIFVPSFHPFFIGISFSTETLVNLPLGSYIFFVILTFLVPPLL